MKIWAHTLVRNEERYIWFSVMSVINYVDKILIWDTGSTDNTVSIIREIKKKYPEKIDFKKVGKVDAQKNPNNTKTR
ncbi:MAG: Glycosyl transferase family 2 [Candidatus Woesebacteria bacterium GW2011_GWA1_39_21b]|uniref:Glycosyl transferase family 2 n=1 Tax=Candidatus Woesebacteria bacterium GW2011_GWA1_39_21b TaxID=1618551 RepID=A0A0G0N6W8_9BACT|nr:MAG: Glycosyl transferase family 2 [Candidatus Woesebacteria bacterium GW2011_GWA1_39_21b]